MITITLVKFRHRPTKEEIEKAPQAIQEAGAKIISSYWTLGRYDAVVTVEAPDERVAMQGLSKLLDAAATETLVAIPREEALKLAGY
ncbi:MAG: GYD domain-containing protein [Bacteroidota bacterium]|jgi:uncharacterized protein with GYD domain